MIGCCLLSCLSSPTLSNRIALGVSPTTVPRRRYCVLLNMPYEHVSVFSFHRLERDDGGRGGIGEGCGRAFSVRSPASYYTAP